MDLTDAPLLGVLAEQGPAGVRVDVDPTSEVASDAVEEALRVALAGELTRLLRATRVLAPTGSVAAAGSLVDARHGSRNPPLATLSQSSKSPQVLSESSEIED